MKKVALTLVALLMTISPAFSEHVTVQTAQRAAHSFLNSKMGGNPQIHLIDFAEKDEFPNFYVFGNVHCFVIIAADDCVHPVLGYSTEGGFGTIDIPDAVSDWLKAYDREITSIKECRLVSTVEIRSEWGSLLKGRGLEQKSRSRVDPLIRTRWGQSTPFNNMCPVDSQGPGGHAKAGCGAVAMAQIMNYWEHPVRGVDSISYTPTTHQEYGRQFADFGNTVYDWDNMKNDYSRCYSDTEAEAVATLVYHCGVSVEMDYGPLSSSVRKKIMDDAFRDFFNYNPSLEYYSDTSFTIEQWIARLKADLDNGQPVLYRGSNYENDNGGHIFVCDGYDENNLFHINWGWNGSCDGFYAIGSLNPGNADYSYHNYAIFDCYPNPTTVSPPSNVNIEVEGRDVTITWTMVANASYYRLYRDDDLIENHLTSLSYVDENVFYGTHSYYMKSVESDGTMSLRSDVVVADVYSPGPMPSNLQAVVNNHDVNLLWDTPTPESAILQYGAGSYVQGFPANNSQGIYWAQRHPASVLSNHIGKAINKVSVFFKSSGNYLMQVCLGDECGPEEILYQREYEASAESWQDINVDSSVLIDFTQDLWIVMYGDSSIVKPATWCSYSGTGVENSAYYSFNGNNWLNLPGNYRSWMIKTHLTDGTYTYNLYRNGEAVATNLSNNIYTDSNLPDGIYDYHVTTNYFGGESDPSNTVNVQVGTPSLQTIDFVQGVNWFSTNVEITLNDLKAALLTALPETAITIKSKTQSAKYVVRTHSWNGTLDWDIMQMYKILVPSACEITLVGLPINPAEYLITISSGSNWIGYPLAESMTVTAALVDFGAVNGEVIKSKTGSARYWNGSWRSNGLDFLEPGRGYVYQSSTSSDRTLIYPSAK